MPARDLPVVAMTVETAIGRLRELIERIPEHKNPVVATGKAERSRARAALKQLVLELRQVELAAEAGDVDAALSALGAYRAHLDAAAPDLEDAESFSLFNPDLQRAYAASLEALQAPLR